MNGPHVTAESCPELRTSIYSMIFPRWLLILVIALVGTLIGVGYTLVGRNGVATAEAMKKAENNDTKFSLQIEPTKETLVRIETQLGDQQKLLIAIDKKLPNGH